MRQILVVLAGAVLWAGCGRSASDFCGDYIDALAAKSETCSGAPADLTKQFFGEICPEINKGLANGHLKYDSSHGDKCIDSVKNASCDALDDTTNSECELSLAGTVAAGGACIETADCASDGICEVATGACGGTCKARIAVGQPCQPGDTCVSNAFCASNVCTAAPPTQNTRVAEGGDCSTNRCSSGLKCDDSHKCVKVVREGQACTPGQHLCAEFLFCGTDSKCARPSGVGSACGVLASGEFAFCLDKTYCKTDGTGSAGTCATLKTTGADCANSSECEGSCSSGKCIAACVEP